MAVILRNNAVSRLGASLTAAATSLSVTAGDGAKFPSPTGGDWFPLTLIKADGTNEILRCTARNGDVLTITRAQENTAAVAFSAGDRVELRLTNGALGEFAQFNSLNTWSKPQTFLGENKHQAAVVIDNGSADSPEVYWKTPSYSAFADLYNNSWRLHGYKGVTDLGDMIGFNMDTKVGYVFGGQVWTSNNFDPNNYLAKGAKAADSELLDGTDGAEYLRRRQRTPNMEGTYFQSGSPPYISGINGDQPALTISNQGNQSASAVIQFHREGSWAAYFGVDTDNIWKVGGRSMGANSYALWHDGMDTTSRVKNGIATTGAGEVGSYAFAWYSGNVDPGNTVGGGSLLWGSFNSKGFGGLTGTWRCMGYVRGDNATLWLRVN